MRPEEFDFLYQLEEKFWWFVAMRQITDAVVEREFNRSASFRILDAGCGTGFNLSHFSSMGPHEVFGLDFSRGAIEGVRKRGFTRVSQASITDIPYAAASFDFVFSFEVLCQVSPAMCDKALREIHRVLRPGGYFFVRLPAYQWMFSSHDVAVGSHRRFGRRQLVREMTVAGLKVEWSSYANCFLFPAVLARRALKSLGVGEGSDVRPLPSGLSWIDPIFRTILASEAVLFRNQIPLPFGLSVIALARKPVA